MGSSPGRGALPYTGGVMTATVPGASSAETLRGAPVAGGPVNALAPGALLGVISQDAAAGAMLGTCM